jgi:hypothetical protein
VYQNPADGTLGFNYLFTRTGGVSDLARATIGSLSNPWLGVTISDTGAYGTGSSTAAPLAPDWADGYPLFLSRAAASSGAGISITWESGNQGTYLNSSVNSASGRNDYSADIFFVTDATAYAATNVGLLDSGAVSQSQALAPSGVPEPASLVMIIFGLAGMGLLCLARRRRANARAVLDAESEIDEPWVISLPQAEACRSKRLAA